MKPRRAAPSPDFGACLRRRSARCPASSLIKPLLLLGLGACATEPLVLKADPEAEVSQLDASQGQLRPLGKTPLPLSDLEGTSILRVARPGYGSETLIIVESEAAEGTLELKLAKFGTSGEPSWGLGRRLDLLLRAHRAFLLGRFEEAEALLKPLDLVDGADFGASVLRGNIAAVEGRYRDAARYFQIAKGLNPEFQLPGGAK